MIRIDNFSAKNEALEIALVIAQQRYFIFVLKGKSGSSLSKFNRKSKIFRIEQWKFDVNRIKNKEDMKVWIFVIFNKTLFSWTVDYDICKWVIWLSHRLTIFHVFCIYNFENFISPPPHSNM